MKLLNTVAEVFLAVWVVIFLILLLKGGCQ